MKPGDWFFLVTLSFLFFSISDAKRPDFVHHKHQVDHNSAERGFHVATCDEDGVYSHRFSQTSHQTQTLLEYKAKRAQNVFVLDDDEHVHQVSCKFSYDGSPLNKLVLHVMEQKPEWVQNSILVGGEEWGCLDRKRQPTVILQKVFSVSYEPYLHHHQQGYLALISTQNASYEDVFAFADASYSRRPLSPKNEHAQSEDDGSAQLKAQQEHQAAMTAYIQQLQRSQASFDKKRSPQAASITLLSPNEHSAFGPGNEIQVVWQNTEIPEDSQITVELRVRNKVGHSTVHTVQVQTSESGGNTSFTVDPKWAPSDHYFVFLKFRGRCILPCDATANSENFPVNVLPEIAFSRPKSSDIFFPGDTLHVIFVAPKQKPDEKVTVALLRQVGPVVPPYKVTEVQTTFNNPNVSFPVDKSWTDSSKYYVRISYDCGILGCRKEYSPFFSVVTSESGRQGSRLEVRNPKVGDVFMGPSDVMHVEWDLTFSGDITAVSLKVDSWFDHTVQKWEKVPNTGKMEIPIHSGWKASTSYYLKFEYACKVVIGGIRLFCKTAESPIFAINKVPAIVVRSPTAGQMFNDDGIRSIPLTWTSTLPPNTPLTISLKQHRPLLWANTLEFQTVRNIPVSAGTWTANVSHAGAFFPVYFEISYNCLVSHFFCEHANSPLFSVPAHRVVNFNYDNSTGRAKREIPLTARDCSSCSDSLLSSVSPLCLQCSLGLNPSVGLSCSDCWSRTELDVMDLQFSVGHHGVSRVNLESRGKTDVNVEFAISANSPITFSITQSILPMPIPVFGYGFRIAGIPFRVGMTFDVLVDASTTISLEQPELFRFGADMELEFQNKLHTEPKLGVDSNAKMTRMNPHSPSISLGSTLRSSSDFGIIYSLDLGVTGLVTVGAQVRPSIGLDTGVSFPFPPLATPPHALIHTGNCSTEHLFEYNLTFGAELRVSAELGMQGVASLPWSRTPFQLNPRPNIATGCHLPAEAVSEKIQTLGRLVGATQNLLNDLAGKLHPGGKSTPQIHVLSSKNSSSSVELAVTLPSPATPESLSSVQETVASQLQVPVVNVHVSADPNNPSIALVSVSTVTKAAAHLDESIITDVDKKPANRAPASLWWIVVGAAIVLVLVVGAIVIIRNGQKNKQVETA